MSKPVTVNADTTISAAVHVDGELLAFDEQAQSLTVQACHRPALAALHRTSRAFGWLPTSHALTPIRWAAGR